MAQDAVRPLACPMRSYPSSLGLADPAAVSPVYPRAVGKIEAPFTDEQVADLRAHQANPRVHPYTSESGKDLIPTRDGWVEELGGPVVQTWAHDFGPPQEGVTE